MIGETYALTLIVPFAVFAVIMIIAEILPKCKGGQNEQSVTNCNHLSSPKTSDN